MSAMIESPGQVVLDVDRSFRAVGVASPTQFRPHLLDAGADVVVIDAVRCSSTLVGALAAGAAGIIVRSKASVGEEAGVPPLRLLGVDVDVVHAGELHGLAIPGALFGNSVIDLPVSSIAGRVVVFSSTNFGAMWEKVVGSTDADGPPIHVATFANVDAVADRLALRRRRVVLCLGGFYNRSSIEDHVVAGRILRRMGVAFDELDDDATLMRLAADHHFDGQGLVQAIEGNRIGRSLHRFGRTSDIRANVLGVGVDAGLWATMTTLVPTVTWVGDVPVLVSGV